MTCSDHAQSLDIFQVYFATGEVNAHRLLRYCNLICKSYSTAVSLLLIFKSELLFLNRLTGCSVYLEFQFSYYLLVSCAC